MSVRNVATPHCKYNNFFSLEEFFLLFFKQIYESLTKTVKMASFQRVPWFRRNDAYLNPVVPDEPSKALEEMCISFNAAARLFPCTTLPRVLNGRCWELVGSTISRYLFWIDIACNLPCRHLRHNICAVFRLRLVDEEFMVAYWMLLSLNFSRGMPRASATSAINVFSFV